MKLTIWTITIITIFLNKEALSQKTFNSRAKNDRTIYVSIAGKTGGNISKKELLSAGKVDLMNNPDSAYKIISFNLAMVCRGWDVFEVTSNSNQITEAMKKGIARLSAHGGCHVWFSIKCLGINRDTLKLSTVEFITKEPDANGK